MSDTIHQTIADLIAGHTLPEDDARSLFTQMLEGDLLPEQIAAVLALLETRSPTTDELVGAARVMRERVTPVQADPDDPRPLIDTCGTGGAPKTFNVSTASAIVAAATSRVRACKHGNRSRTGRGSAEVLAALGVNVDASPAVQARCLRDVGVCFSFAIHHHPAMKHAIGPRRALAVTTIFNLLGPLTNPAGARRQLLGVFRPDKADLMAQAIARLGCDRAMLVHAEDGLDEISIGEPTNVWDVSDGRVATSRIDPPDLGIDTVPRHQLVAQDIDDSAAIIRRVFAGEPGPHADMVALNAAAALVVGGAHQSLSAALADARETIAAGNAARTLEQLADASLD